MDKPAARIEGVSIGQSDNYTLTHYSRNLIKRNVPQSNVTWSNKSNVVTVIVFGNLYEAKKSPWRSAFPTGTSVNFPRENSLPPREWE